MLGNEFTLENVRFALRILTQNLQMDGEAVGKLKMLKSYQLNYLAVDKLIILDALF